MSVSVHCMRLAASYDTLTEDKLRYRRKYFLKLDVILYASNE